MHIFLSWLSRPKSSPRLSFKSSRELLRKTLCDKNLTAYFEFLWLQNSSLERLRNSLDPFGKRPVLLFSWTRDNPSISREILNRPFSYFYKYSIQENKLFCCSYLDYLSSNCQWISRYYRDKPVRNRLFHL